MGRDPCFARAIGPRLAAFEVAMGYNREGCTVNLGKIGEGRYGGTLFLTTFPELNP
tara:strand:- start:676 stop:843 length:168 start_codon:yes stop_codon:yes gene_type:complete